jgi:hypothetical protein
MESRESSESRDEHAHWVSVVPEGLHHVVDFHVVESMRHYLLSEELKLGRSRKLSVDEKECNFKEGGLLSQLFDGIPSVLKNTFVSIDERDSRNLSLELEITQLTVFMYPGSKDLVTSPPGDRILVRSEALIVLSVI